MKEEMGDRCAAGKRSRIEQVKAQVIEKHAEWLAASDTEELYTRFTHVWRVERILDFTKEIDGKVLDIGCFVGIVAEKILNQGGKEVLGMDRLERALELASARGIQTVLADLDDGDIDFPDNHFDCVVATEVLNYVFDPDGVIEEVHRILKPGGKLIITVPNLASIGNRILMMLGRPIYSMDVRPRHADYVRYFSFDTMQNLLVEYGFDVKRIESSVFVSPIVYFQFKRWPWIHKLLASKGDWRRRRIYFSKYLARIFPRMAEDIIVFAEKPVRQ